MHVQAWGCLVKNKGTVSKHSSGLSFVKLLVTSRHIIMHFVRVTSRHIG